MKVIGTTDDGYICEVSHTELEKLTDKYYGNLKPLTVGSTLDLGAGYDFRSSIQSACSGMVDATKQFEQSQKLLMRFAVMVASLPAPNVDGAHAEVA